MYLHHPFCSLRSLAWCKRIFLSTPRKGGDIRYSFDSTLRRTSRDATARRDAFSFYPSLSPLDLCPNVYDEERRAREMSCSIFLRFLPSECRLMHGRHLIPLSASYLPDEQIIPASLISSSVNILKREGRNTRARTRSGASALSALKNIP